MKKLYLLSLYHNDFDVTQVDGSIPDSELEYVVTEHAVRLFPDDEQIYYYDEKGNFTIDIMTSAGCLNRFVYG